MCHQFHVVHGVQGDDSPERPLGGPGLRRTNSFSDWESLHNVWTAAEVIKAAGYPLEQHTVTTSDGYILRMERLPRHGTALLALQTPKEYMLHSLQLYFRLISNPMLLSNPMLHQFTLVQAYALTQKSSWCT